MSPKSNSNSNNNNNNNTSGNNNNNNTTTTTTNSVPYQGTLPTSTPRSPFLYPQPEDIISEDAESFVLDTSLRDPTQTASGDWAGANSNSLASVASAAVQTATNFDSIAEEPESYLVNPDDTSNNNNSSNNTTSHVQNDDYQDYENDFNYKTAATTTTTSSSVPSSSNNNAHVEYGYGLSLHDWYSDDGSSDEDDLDTNDELETVHIDGLPKSENRLDSRSYTTPPFAQTLLEILGKDLQVPGWDEFVNSNSKHIHTNGFHNHHHNHDDNDAEDDEQEKDQKPVVMDTQSSSSDHIDAQTNNDNNNNTSTSTSTSTAGLEPQDYSSLIPHLSIFKISGALTNAVFFVSLPQQYPAPTVLLRVYGPSSGSIISRRKEIYVLHTLSSKYGIGPLVLGTFENGRVEEHFNSRALTKEELRNPKMVRWIARRMKELHSVSIDEMLPPDDPARMYRNPSVRSKASTSSLQSLDSNVSSSAFSLGSCPSVTASPSLQPTQPSGGSNSSVRRLSLASTGSGSFRPPPGIREGPAVPKKRRSSKPSTTCSTSRSRSRSNSVESSSKQSTRSRNRSSTLSSVTDTLNNLTLNNQQQPLNSRGRSSTRRNNNNSNNNKSSSTKREPLACWDNLSRWSKIAKSLIEKIQSLNTLVPEQGQGQGQNFQLSPNDPLNSETWFQSPAHLMSFIDTFDLDSLVSDLKTYKEWIIDQDAIQGGGYGSKIVFAHNDTQYGNVLLAAQEDWEEKKSIRQRQAHERIVVIDFEYAGPNPRAYDIANYFCEWQADYHHDTLSYSLSHHHPFPTKAQRYEFYRAYVGMDGGADRTDDDDNEDEDYSHLPEDQSYFLSKLDNEVLQWKSVSDGLWALWAVIQATQDVTYRVDAWFSNSNESFPEIEFDYLAYALDRATHFRNRQPPSFAKSSQV